MNTNLDPQSVRKGVDDAFTYWLIDHEISFPTFLQDTIAATFSEWLEIGPT